MPAGDRGRIGDVDRCGRRGGTRARDPGAVGDADNGRGDGGAGQGGGDGVRGGSSDDAGRDWEIFCAFDRKISAR